MPGLFSEGYPEAPIKVFLGGTTNDSEWRNTLTDNLSNAVGWFDPVVTDWTEEDQAIEKQVRETSDYTLYVITSLMSGVYSIAEAVDDSHRKPKKTLFLVMDNDKGSYWSTAERKSLAAVEDMLKRNGATVFENLPQVADFLNARGLNLSITPSMEGEKWSGPVTKHEKWHPADNFFKKSPTAIANGLIKASKDKRQAISRLQFYINRAGKNLSSSDRKRLETAKELIQKHYAKLNPGQESVDDKPVTVVIIQGNPKYIRGNPDAKTFYQELRSIAEAKGASVTFDPGEPMTTPKPADIWIGHSRGTDRLRFAPKGTRCIALGASSKGAINHPKDNATTLSGKPPEGWKPNAEHFTVTPEMKKAIEDAIDGAEANTTVSQESALPPSANW